MEPFSTELLTILVLISIILSGITTITLFILLIIFIYKSCSKRRQLKSIKPIKVSSTISLDRNSSVISHIPTKSSNEYKKSKHHHYDTNSILDEHSYNNSNKKKLYQQQKYILDENDETTTINESQMYTEHKKIRQDQSIKPVTNVRLFDRHTPYPPDVIAREKLMYNNRFSMDNKY